MSSGYLIVSEINLDKMKKNRYMRFEGRTRQSGYYVYERMEYLNQNCSLVDRISDNLFCLSEYAFSFFEGLRQKEIYFVYFLLEKQVDLEDIAVKACKEIKSKTKIPRLYLFDKKRHMIEINQIYCLSYECAKSYQ